MQQTCLTVGEAFKSFKGLLREAKKGTLDQKPKAPNYRKPNGLFTVSYPKRWLKLADGLIRFPLGNQVKAWFGISEFYLPMPTNLNWSDIKEIRLLPRNRCFYAEFVYEQPEVKAINLDNSKALGIDHGVDNWLTCVSSIGTSLLGLRLDGVSKASLTAPIRLRIWNVSSKKSLLDRKSNESPSLSSRGEVNFTPGNLPRDAINYKILQGS